MNPSIIRNGMPWHDATGKIITAHGGGFLQHDGWTYWFGEVHTLGVGNKTGIACYRSRDLVSWESRGLALPKEALPEKYRDEGVCERPKVLFNPRTGKFVMWMHLDAEGYTAAEAGVATADNPEGPYKFVKAFRPIKHDYGYCRKDDGSETTEADAPRIAAVDERGRGNTFRDMALLADGGEAYVFYASECNSTLYVSRLEPDFLDVERPEIEGKTWVRALPFRSREGPAPFKHAGRCYMFTSGLTGWAPNPARLHVADHPLGPWKDAGDPCFGPECETTFRSQSTFVLNAPSGPPGSYIFCGDRWLGDALSESTYVWIPFAFRADGNVILEPLDSWNMGIFTEGPPPAAVTDLQSLPDGDHRMKLVWTAVAGAHAYRIYANQRYVAMTSAPEFTLPLQFPGITTSWKVVPWHLRHGAGIASNSVVTESPPARDCWLDEHAPERWSQGYASPSSRRNVLGGPLKTGGHTFDRGIGTHSPGELCYNIGGEFARFECVAGIDDAHPGQAIFSVYGDGRVLWQSDRVATGEAKSIAVDVQGVHELRLVVAQAAGAAGAYAIWADAKLHIDHSISIPAPRILSQNRS